MAEKGLFLRLSIWRSWLHRKKELASQPIAIAAAGPGQRWAPRIKIWPCKQQALWALTCCCSLCISARSRNWEQSQPSSPQPLQKGMGLPQAAASPLHTKRVACIAWQFHSACSNASLCSAHTPQWTMGKSLISGNLLHDSETRVTTSSSDDNTWAQGHGLTRDKPGLQSILF